MNFMDPLRDDDPQVVVVPAHGRLRFSLHEHRGRSPPRQMPWQGNCRPNGGMDVGIDDHPPIVQPDGNRWDVSRMGVGVGMLEQALTQRIYHLSIGQLCLSGKCRTSKMRAEHAGPGRLSKDQGTRTTSIQKDIGQGEKSTTRRTVNARSTRAK